MELLKNRARVCVLNGIDRHLIVYDPNKGLWGIMRIVQTRNEELYDAHINDDGGVWHSTNDVLEIMEQESGVKTMTADNRVAMNKILHEIRTGDTEIDSDDISPEFN